MKEDFELMLFDRLEMIRQDEFKQCWSIWEPVYNEYLKLNYRGMQPKTKSTL